MSVALFNDRIYKGNTILHSQHVMSYIMYTNREINVFLNLWKIVARKACEDLIMNAFVVQNPRHMYEVLMENNSL